jgi:phenylalanyl-tRNA synthetase beta chain
MVRILTQPGFQGRASNKALLLLTPPSYRFDMSIEEDLIEEIARIYGYDIPSTLPHLQVSMDYDDTAGF